MAKKSWLADAMRGPIGDASVAALDAGAQNGHGREQIAYIPRTALVADEKNFYSIEGIDELAANIETVGLLDPLRVRPVEGEEGLYRIVSGHRRRAALDKLALDGNMSFEQVPVIIETADVSPAMQELRLIYANNDTRHMSSADLAKQAERVTELLYQLKEEGFEFPGRMRDHVAEACRVSKTKLANLKVIHEGLAPEWKKLWESGVLNDACALTLARAPEEAQRAVFRVKGKHVVAEWVIADLLKCDTRAMAEKYGCGEHCTAMEEKMAINSDYCRSYCCKDCPNISLCKGSCRMAANEKVTAKNREAAAEAKRKKEEAARRDQMAAERSREQDFAKRGWLHFGAAAKAAGLSTVDALKLVALEDADEDDVANAEARFRGELPNDRAFYLFDTEPFEYIPLGELRSAADRLGVSLDYLLCRTDEPQGAPKMDTTDARPAGEQRNGTPTDRADDARPQWRTGVPEKGGLYWCKFESEGESLCMQAQWNDMLRCWDHAPGGTSIQLDCVAWYPLPEDAV